MAIKIFDQLLLTLDSQLVQIFNTIQIDNNKVNLDKLGIKAPSATWTYLINDNPFEHVIGMQFIGDAGKQIGAVMMTPLLAWHFLFGKKRKY